MLAVVLQPADVQREQLAFADFGDHPRELFLHELVRGDGFVGELLARFGVLQRGVDSRPWPRRSRPSRCRSAPAFRQPSGPFRPVTAGSIFSSGISQSVKPGPEVTDARSDHLPCTSQALKPGVPFSTRKP
jgi:hypothetical protein